MLALVAVSSVAALPAARKSNDLWYLDPLEKSHQAKSAMQQFLAPVVPKKDWSEHRDIVIRPPPHLPPPMNEEVEDKPAYVISEFVELFPLDDI
ncbi:hypothetical protein LTR78_003390 [Recurvomyces mirabilis]|uniref:Uncharacterized protein n=1 Tax=Recurvomyces mirabilis TaxID=574656 RepID=A0AAE0WRD2_9PEZI|nr:hypothetical protein LTR78_003390 [Recurvomyces mirabilis]KAK5154574.1 hypothetical protein LTS14_006712 [Recurvomyces mirabilis]